MKFKLKEHIDMISFLQEVKACNNTVTFETPDGDILNLKSQLSKYIFLAAVPDSECLKNSMISCSKEDAVLLTDYII